MSNIMDNEFMQSVNDTIKKRTASPVYGTYIIYWVIFHWQLIYTAFFVSEDKIWASSGLLRNEYLYKTFFNYNNLSFYLYWILPAILTFLTIWYFPVWFGIAAFSKDEEFRIKKRKIRIQKNKELEVEETKLEEKNVERLETVEKKVKKEKDIKFLDPTIEWQKDYEKFKQTKFFKSFNFIIESIYKQNGWIKKNVGYNVFQIPQDLLAYAHTNNLVKFINKSEQIELTDKGKFFVKNYTIEGR